MSKILISGCGISWSKQERPSWVKVLKLCGADINDISGPAISNTLILNRSLSEVIKNEYDQCVCQLTMLGKLDVEITGEDREKLWRDDPIRNFTQDDFWPSSLSDHHQAKKTYYKYLYSPTIEQDDLIYKVLLLQKICKEKNIRLHTILGYNINIEIQKRSLLDIDFTYNIYDDYRQGAYWQYHDHNNTKNTVPNKYFQIYLAKKINKEFLKLPIEDKLKKFHD